MSTADRSITVEVVFALPDRQVVCPLTLTEGTAVAGAVEQAQLSSLFCFGMLETHRVGIHGHVVASDHLLRDGDRVEIYRPLTLDPMQARRRRAGAT